MVFVRPSVACAGVCFLATALAVPCAGDDCPAVSLVQRSATLRQFDRARGYSDATERAWLPSLNGDVPQEAAYYGSGDAPQAAPLEGEIPVSYNSEGVPLAYSAAQDEAPFSLAASSYDYGGADFGPQLSPSLAGVEGLQGWPSDSYVFAADDGGLASSRDGAAPPSDTPPAAADAYDSGLSASAPGDGLSAPRASQPGDVYGDAIADSVHAAPLPDVGAAPAPQDGFEPMAAALNPGLDPTSSTVSAGYGAAADDPGPALPVDKNSATLRPVAQEAQRNVTSGKCTPQCTWQCENQFCDEVCTPRCQAPICETRCNGHDLSGCSMQCHEPSCATLCPQRSCAGQSCPLCQTTCSDPKCKLVCPDVQPCRTVCEQPKCEWDCKAPAQCPKPKCQMVCESPRHCTGSTHIALPPLRYGETSVKQFTPTANAGGGVSQQFAPTASVGGAAASGAAASGAIAGGAVASGAISGGATSTTNPPFKETINASSKPSDAQVTPVMMQVTAIVAPPRRAHDPPSRPGPAAPPSDLREMLVTMPATHHAAR